MSEYHIERGYREVYISDGDSRTSPRSQSPAGGQSNTRGPASAGVPQYKMGPPTYRSGVYLERDNTRPPRPATTFVRTTDSAYPGSHRAQVTYVVQDSNRESPPPPAYSPPRRLSPGRGYPSTELMKGGAPSRMYAAVHKTESAAIPGEQQGMYQQTNQRSPSPYQERGDIETLVPMYTASYPSSERSGERLPSGSPSKIVYSSHTSPQGQVSSHPMNHDPQSASPQSPSVQPQGSPFRPTGTGPAQGQHRAGSRGEHSGASPRPYQLRPVLDSYSEGPASPKQAPVGGKEAEVDALTNLLIQNMEVSGDPDFFGQCHSCGHSIMGESNACEAMDKVYHTACFLCVSCGMCVKCGHAIMGDKQGCSALDQLFHIDCFSCSSCGLCLKGHQFFAMEGKPYCEPCYMNTLEKCSVCSRPITDRILRATGKPYHPDCFTCVVCGKSLDGVQFTVDATNQIHCIEDFHKKFAPRCCVCDGPIMPETGEEETVRIVALDRSFHVKCYKCEDCGLQLSSEADGRGCYPLDEHILCKQCNAKRIQAMTTRMMTEL